jgi:hypothetical protein
MFKIQLMYPKLKINVYFIFLNIGDLTFGIALVCMYVLHVLFMKYCLHMSRLCNYRKPSYRIFIIALCVGDLSTIQSVPGGKVGILGDHNIGHSKQKYYVCMCPISKGFRDRSISLYNSKIFDKKILHTVSNTGIYLSSEKLVQFN